MTNKQEIVVAFFGAVAFVVGAYWLCRLGLEWRLNK